MKRPPLRVPSRPGKFDSRGRRYVTAAVSFEDVSVQGERARKLMEATKAILETAAGREGFTVGEFFLMAVAYEGRRAPA